MTRLIDADKLKEKFPKDEDWEYPVNTNSYVCECIDRLPTESINQWILISESLPDTEEIVILSTRSSVEVGYYDGNNFFRASIGYGDYFDLWGWEPNVIAWMPLPKVYEGENI